MIACFSSSARYSAFSNRISRVGKTASAKSRQVPINPRKDLLPARSPSWRSILSSRLLYSSGSGWPSSKRCAGRGGGVNFGSGSPWAYTRRHSGQRSVRPRSSASRMTSISLMLGLPSGAPAGVRTRSRAGHLRTAPAEHRRSPGPGRAASGRRRCPPSGRRRRRATDSTFRTRRAGRGGCRRPRRRDGSLRQSRSSAPPDLLAQSLLRDFTDSRGGKAIANLQPLGQLELGDQLLAQEEVVELGERERGAGAQHHARAGPFAEDVVGDGDDGHVQHGGMAQDQVLDFLGADLLAPSVDQILLAALPDQISARVHAHHVTGAIEAVVGEGRAVVLGGPVVAPDRVGPAALELTDLAGPDLLAVVVDDADLVARRRRATLSVDDHVDRIVEARGTEEALG